MYLKVNQEKIKSTEVIEDVEVEVVTDKDKDGKDIKKLVKVQNRLPGYFINIERWEDGANEEKDSPEEVDLVKVKDLKDKTIKAAINVIKVRQDKREAPPMTLTKDFKTALTE